MTLPSGSRLGPYEILATLGSGSMGEVYRARDARLGRVVAVKVLPEALSEDRERLLRFESEARAASALNHPNIVTIHDIGSGATGTYLAMELIEGETLREKLVAGPLAMAPLAAIASQVADGLAAAHESGIVHRDLKPENVMIRRDGLVKILDFGLAKSVPAAASPPDATQAPTQTSLTEPGVVLGTVGYMSPEQAAGRPADARSDQFSLGAILYEMATGRRAFQRQTAVETLSAILREEPPSLEGAGPGVSEPLRWAIERCLAKDPAERYASTRDLARDLARVRERPGEAAATSRRPRARTGLRVLAVALVVAALSAAAVLLLRDRALRDSVTESRASIAILPFQNVGERKEDEYFSDGMTDSLITELARVPGLLVIARNSAFQYKGRTADVREVGRKLGVRYVLEGSVQRAGDAVRVNAQLVDCGTGYHLWAEKYDRPMRDIFALQDDISRHITGSLKLALAPSVAGTPAPPTQNLEAYDAYLRGVHLLHQLDQREHANAIPMFEKAIALDPGFAVAHAAMARAYISTFFSLDPDPKWKAKAEAAIGRALALDPILAEVYVARGDLAWTLVNGFPHEEAVRDFRKALEINPNLAEARRALGRVYMHVGLLDRAAEQWDLALRVDPEDLWVIYRMGSLRLYGGDPERALRELRRHPETEHTQDVALALLWLGRDAEASEVMERLFREPADTEIHAAHAVLLARRGDRAGMEEAIAGAVRIGKGLGHFHHAEYDIATAYAVLGNPTEAVSWLRRAAADGFPCYPLFEKDPLLDPIRRDPAFVAFLAERKKDWERYRAIL